jgi:hypothetical protein
MLSENHERAVALLARKQRRDDYGTLLLERSVHRSLDGIEDPEAWRAEIRRQARADKIRVQTGISRWNVWAALRREPTEAEIDAWRPWLRLASGAHATTVKLGHEWILCRDRNEGAVACERCGAVGYLNADEDLVDGDIFEAACEGSDGG